MATRIKGQVRAPLEAVLVALSVSVHTSEPITTARGRVDYLRAVALEDRVAAIDAMKAARRLASLLP